MIARPTQNTGLYVQMVGRGLRLHPGQGEVNLIHCAGITGCPPMYRGNACRDWTWMRCPNTKKDRVQGDLFDLPDIVPSVIRLS